ncbi:MAG: ACT domain-containing protein, partial [Rikenellaceae bacterium]
VILIKIADRLEVMRSLRSFPLGKRTKKSWETLHLYAPIAHKLGLYNIKSEMEDLALYNLETKEYLSIQKKLADSESERQVFIADFVVPINEKLEELGVKYKLKARTKSIYSIWRKMKRQKVPFEKVFDIFAIRIIVDCPPEQEKSLCWVIYSIVTDCYLPNSDRMRDWVSIPKSNGYESLHATVVTTSGRWVEVQIRSHRMDEVAEKGMAAHWRYKGVSGAGVSSEQWLEKLRFAVENSPSDLGFGDELDMQLNSSEIFVFTPTGDIRKLPTGSTLLDFAFDIHSNIGTTCVGGRINGRNVSIKETLKSGDIAEVITSKNQSAKADWLSFVVTGKAKSKIKQELREDAASAALLGREELERKVKNWKLQLTIEEAVTTLVKHYRLKTGLEVYMMIANDKISMLEVKDVLTGGANEPHSPEPKPRKSVSKVEKRSENDGALVVDQNLKDVEYKLGKCCNPIFGDDIFGFVTIHSGITIHSHSCPNALRLKEQYPYRVLEARWRDTFSGGKFLSNLKVVSEDRQGLTNDIMDLVSRELKINIRSVNFSSRGGLVEGRLSIEVGTTTQVDMVVANIKKLKGVLKAQRIN